MTPRPAPSRPLAALLLVALAVAAAATTHDPAATTHDPAATTHDPAFHTFEPVPPRPDLDAAEVIELYGEPDFAVGGILAYQRSFAGVPADVSFFFVGATLREITFAFPVENRSPRELRREADRVLKRLRVTYGPPVSRSAATGEFKTHVWQSEAGELIHTVVFAPGSQQHVIRTIRR